MKNYPISRSSNTLKVEKTRRLSIEKDLRARAVRTDSLAEGNDAPKTENLRQRWQKNNGTQSKTWAQYLVSLLDWVEGVKYVRLKHDSTTLIKVKYSRYFDLRN